MRPLVLLLLLAAPGCSAFLGTETDELVNPAVPPTSPEAMPRGGATATRETAPPPGDEPGAAEPPRAASAASTNAPPVAPDAGPSKPPKPHEVDEEDRDEDSGGRGKGKGKRRDDGDDGA